MHIIIIVKVAHHIELTMLLRSSSFRNACNSKRFLHVSSSNSKESYKFLVCGGGTGGLAVASSLARRFGESQIAVVEPSDVSIS